MGVGGIRLKFTKKTPPLVERQQRGPLLLLTLPRELETFFACDVGLLSVAVSLSQVDGVPEQRTETPT